MVEVYQTLTPPIRDFIAAQPMFFVGTAPLASDGLLNLSPKGLDTFRVFDDTTVGYLDLTGSGVETIAHIRENKRIVIMFCSFSKKPKIIRIHGRAEAIFPHCAEFDTLRPRFPEHPGIRAIIRVQATRIADSCGFSVPIMTLEATRQTLSNKLESLGPLGVKEYHRTRNQRSIEGLLGVGDGSEG